MSPSTAGTTYGEQRRSTTNRNNVTAYDTMFQIGPDTATVLEDSLTR